MCFPKAFRFSCAALLAVVLASLAAPDVQAQQTSDSAMLKGRVLSGENQPVSFANIFVEELEKGQVTTEAGYFQMILPAKQWLTLRISYAGQKKRFSLQLQPGQTRKKKFLLDSLVLPDVLIEERSRRSQVSVTELDPKQAEVNPSPFGGIEAVLKTLPGVKSNNELSSQYSVRGGNFDENLVYVNDIPVYRPKLVSQGQQEGLSFINPNLTKSVMFSAGGWQPRFGDKLSSVLDIEYKTPREWGGSVSPGILTQKAHVEGTADSNRLKFLLGARRKSAEYLFQNSALFQGLDTQGEFMPRFADIQSFVQYDLTPKEKRKTSPNKTTIGWLTSFARNRYFFEPSNRETDFGTINQTLRLFVAFDGTDRLSYNTYQSGIRLKHRFNDRWKSDLTLSGVSSFEREKSNVEGGYRLCDISTDPSSDQFNECVRDRGVGTQFDYARNDLDVRSFNLINRWYYQPQDSSRSEFEFGYRLSHERIDDDIYEYNFLDSADFIDITELLISDISIRSYRVQPYAQHSFSLNQRHQFTYGVRFHYWTLNNQFLTSPRAQYSYTPDWEHDVVFNAAAGVYQQPPFYREMRDRDGNINQDLKAQKSVHLIGGADYRFKIWDREFTFRGEAYYKHLTDVVPFDLQNVRVRYHANNRAEARVYGADFRLKGQFIEGAESWFSFGLLSARENLEDDNLGYIRRPTDQRFNASVFFQDHLPMNPTYRVYLNAVVAGGLPFGPPRTVTDNLDTRNQFVMPTYRRVDIGFSKVVSMEDLDKPILKYFESVWIGVDVMNLLGVSNTVSHTWVQDVSGNQWAVPNTLSQRFLNVRIIGRW